MTTMTRIFTNLLLAGAAMLCGPTILSGATLPGNSKVTWIAPAKQVGPDSYSKNTPVIYPLRAGPIRLKFQDGELRYLYVGDKEIARRLYFGVRDGDWNTAMPKYTRMEVQAGQDDFTVHLEAQCQSDAADYHWQGDIVGKSNGTIQFTAHGEPNKDFHSNRIGLCLLFGSPSLAGQKFETLDSTGTPKAGMFPHLVSPTLVAEKFQTLRYTTGSGMTVSATLTGATFDMEDQRNWGDTSYKAYAPLPYNYPPVAKGDTRQESITLTVRYAPGSKLREEAAVRVTLGKVLPKTAVPQIGTAPAGLPDSPFADLNMDRSKQTGEKTRTWGINPSSHLPDEDTFMENLPAVVAQAATARSFAPNAILQITPARIRGLFPDGKRDPRNENQFGGAWCAALLKYLSLAGVARADFDMGDGPAKAVRERLARLAGHHLYATTVHTSGRALVEAWAIEDGGQPVLWLINLTDHPQKVACENLPRHARAIPFQVNSNPPKPSAETDVTDGHLAMELLPYEVCEVRFRK